MNKKLNWELYKKVYLIRAAEEQIQNYYHEDEMKTPMHMSMGAEAISAGVCHNLEDSDQIFTTYRSHAGFLAKTENIKEFFHEMYARETSTLKGKGGSMHLCLPQKGFMGTSGIVAAHLPVAVGCAWANKVENNKKIVCVFFGDGAIDEGVFWESVNIASLMRLPVIFVCEDNGLAVHTHAEIRHGYDSIARIIERFNCRVVESDSTDVEDIYNLVSSAVCALRKDPEPYFMNFKYYRYLEHVGINHDFDAGYRKKEEFEVWRKKDPVKLQRGKLLKLGFGKNEIEKLEKDIDEEIISVIKSAKNTPLSKREEAYKEVFK